MEEFEVKLSNGEILKTTGIDTEEVLRKVNLDMHSMAISIRQVTDVPKNPVGVAGDS